MLRGVLIEPQNLSKNAESYGMLQTDSFSNRYLTDFYRYILVFVADGTSDRFGEFFQILLMLVCSTQNLGKYAESYEMLQTDSFSNRYLTVFYRYVLVFAADGISGRFWRIFPDFTDAGLQQNLGKNAESYGMLQTDSFSNRYLTDFYYCWFLQRMELRSDFWGFFQIFF